jgi:hypothetical protein
MREAIQFFQNFDPSRKDINTKMSMTRMMRELKELHEHVQKTSDGTIRRDMELDKIQIYYQVIEDLYRVAKTNVKSDLDRLLALVLFPHIDILSGLSQVMADIATRDNQEITSIKIKEMMPMVRWEEAEKVIQILDM